MVKLYSNFLLSKTACLSNEPFASLQQMRSTKNNRFIKVNKDMQFQRKTSGST